MQPDSGHDLGQSLERLARRRRLYTVVMLGMLLTALLGTSIYPYMMAEGPAASPAPASPTPDPFGELEQVVRTHPRDVEALTELGNRYYDAERYADAEGAYRKVLAVTPGNPSVTTDLGTAMFYQKKTLEAIAAWRSVLETHPRQAQARVNLGLAYHSLGQTPKAIREWELARETATDDGVRKTAEQFLAQVRPTTATSSAQPG
jgi:cytochrome c-type biogenesis protein CcmH/NrfG